jgi:hypothetical protein
MRMALAISSGERLYSRALIALSFRADGSDPTHFARFAELAASVLSTFKAVEPRVCAVIRPNDISAEIFNGANQSTISNIVTTLKVQCEPTTGWHKNILGMRVYRHVQADDRWISNARTAYLVFAWL